MLKLGSSPFMFRISAGNQKHFLHKSTLSKEFKNLLASVLIMRLCIRKSNIIKKEKHMKKRIISVLLALVFTLSFLVACGTGGNGSNDLQSIEITDSLGRNITLDAPAQEVISFGPADTSIIIALGEWDRLVARTMFDTQEEIASLPEVDGFNVSVEQIITIMPEVIFAPPGMDDGIVTQLEAVGITIIFLNAAVIEDIYTKIGIISAVLGVSEKGTAMNQEIRSGLAEVAANAPAVGINVYIELDTFGGFWSAGSNTFMNEILEIAGGTNIFSDINGAWINVSEEQVIAANPAIIIVSDFGFADNLIGAVIERAAWGEIDAVRGGRVYAIDANLLNQANQNIVQLAQLLQEMFGE